MSGYPAQKPERQDGDMGHGVSTLVFDLDGTLTDPSLGITRCLNFALREHGIPEVPDPVLVTHIGPPLDEIFLHLIPAEDAGLLDSLIAKYRERYSTVGYAENEVYPGIPAALEALTSAGLRLGVCTSKLASYSEKILELFDIGEHFSFLDGGDVGIKKYQQLAGLLDRGVIDSAAVMIGDRSVDIEAARANGLSSIGVLWGFGSLSEITGAGPTHVTDTVEELVELALGQQ